MSFSNETESAHLSTLADLAPANLILTDSELTVKHINERSIQAIASTSSSFGEVLEIGTDLRTFFNGSLPEGYLHGHEVTVQKQIDGRNYEFHISSACSLANDAQGHVITWLGTARNNSEVDSKVSSLLLRTQSKLIQQTLLCSDIDAAISSITDVLNETFQPIFSEIWLRSVATDELVPAQDTKNSLKSSTILRAEQGTPGRVWSTRKVVLEEISAGTDDPRRAQLAAHGITTAVGFPIVCGGQFYGVIELLFSDLPAPALEVGPIFRKLGGLITTFVGNCHTLQTHRVAVLDGNFLAATAEVLGSTKGTHQAVDAFCETVCSSFHWDHCTIWEGKGTQLSLKDVSGCSTSSQSWLAASITPTPGVLASYTNKDVALISNLAILDPHPIVDWARDRDLRSALTIYLETSEDTCLIVEFYLELSNDLDVGRWNTLRSGTSLLQQCIFRNAELARSRDLQVDNRVLNSLIEQLQNPRTLEEGVLTALETIREGYGWEYGSFWQLDLSDQVLKFAIDSGSVSGGFVQATKASTFPRGVGLAGRTWASNEVNYTHDLASVSDCPRAPEAFRAGIKTGICLPIHSQEKFVGTLDLFATQEVPLPQERIKALESIGRIVSDALTRIENEQDLKEKLQNDNAVKTVLQTITAATSMDEAIKIALEQVKSSFDWAYGSFWARDVEENVLRFALESGEVNEEFRKATSSASFAPGVGLSGRAWAQKDLFFVEDIGEMEDCCRAPIAKAAGVKSGVCFPLLLQGDVYGTLDFFTTETMHLSEERLNAIRSVATLISQNLDRINESARAKEAGENTQAVNGVLKQIGAVDTVRAAIDVALNAVRTEFGWAYASFWKLDTVGKVLRFQQQSGTVNAEFQAVTEKASFAHGVGLSGKTWARGQLFFVKDIGDMVDCCRAPVAKAVGVKSGVCFPILLDGEIYGTMDFFALETLSLSEERLASLRGVADLVSDRVSKVERDERERAAQAELQRKVQVILGELNKAAGGDLSVKIGIEGQDAIGQVAESAQMLIDGLRESISKIAENATTLAGAAEELSAVSTQMKASASQTAESSLATATSAEEVQENIITVATGTEEMTASIKEISRSACEATHVADTAVRTAMSASESVEDLCESSQKIESVVKIINSIASQTNLLALNATIEAARAGSAGRGFAVVANEVKVLARQTAESTGVIDELVSAIQEHTSSVSDRIKEIQKVIQSVNDISASIASAVEEQNATTAEMSRSIDKTAKQTKGITYRIVEVTNAADETTKGAEKTLEASRELAVMANELQALVSRFTW